jgi:hypothetical protein
MARRDDIAALAARLFASPHFFVVCRCNSQAKFPRKKETQSRRRRKRSRIYLMVRRAAATMDMGVVKMQQRMAPESDGHSRSIFTGERNAIQ